MQKFKPASFCICKIYDYCISETDRKTCESILLICSNYLNLEASSMSSLVQWTTMANIMCINIMQDKWYLFFNEITEKINYVSIIPFLLLYFLNGWLTLLMIKKWDSIAQSSYSSFWLVCHILTSIPIF